MYLHIGMDIYLWSESIIGIFDASVFGIPSLTTWDQHQPENFLKRTRIIHYDLQPDEIKSCIITESNEIHLVSIHYSTLQKRWNNCRKKRRKTSESLNKR